MGTGHPIWQLVWVSNVAVFALFVLLFAYITVEQWRRVEDYIKCELISGGSPRDLNTF